MVTTVTASTSAAVATIAVGSLAIVPIMALLVLLIHKETASGLAGPSATRLSRALGIALIPLTIVFLATLVLKLIDVLRPS